MLNIKYDIVGSFLRPQAIKVARAQYASGQLTLPQLREIEDEQIRQLVAKEVAHGLKVVTDGEFRRRWWHLDWLKEFDGFTTRHLNREKDGVVHHIELGYVSGKIAYDPGRPHAEVAAYEFLLAQARQYPGITAKKCISGPNMILVDNYLQLGQREVPYYGSDIQALIEDIGRAYQLAIQDLYDHGCRYLQIDDTSWTYLIDANFLKKVAALGYQKAEVLEWFRQVSTLALAGHPADLTIATHFCKGNFKGQPLFAGLYDSVAPIISQLPYDGYFVEYDDERSGSFAPWARLRGSGKTFVAGLISTKNPQLESHEQLRRRYAEARAVVGDNIALSPQCGFASVEEGNSIDEATQWQKIDLLVSCQDFL